MGHTFHPVTTSDRTYTPVSDVTPSGTVEDKFTWVNIAANHSTWALLTISGKTHWCDWLYGTAFTDAWTSLTNPDKTYNSVTKSDRTYTTIITPSQTYKEVSK